MHNGAPVFRGTRVSFQTSLDCLEAGDTLDDFLCRFPALAESWRFPLEKNLKKSGRRNKLLRISKDFYMKFAIAGAVEFAEKDALPTT